MADETERLKSKIAELEKALEIERRKKGPRREKIDEMSSEVVDSNPYRLVLETVRVKYYFRSTQDFKINSLIRSD